MADAQRGEVVRRCPPRRRSRSRRGAGPGTWRAETPQRASPDIAQHRQRAVRPADTRVADRVAWALRAALGTACGGVGRVQQQLPLAAVRRRRAAGRRAHLPSTRSTGSAACRRPRAGPARRPRGSHPRPGGRRACAASRPATPPRSSSSPSARSQVMSLTSEPCRRRPWKNRRRCRAGCAMAQRRDAASEREQRLLPLVELPVVPANAVVLAVGVVVPALRAAHLVAAADHRHALREQQRGQEVALLALAQRHEPPGRRSAPRRRSSTSCCRCRRRRSPRRWPRCASRRS